MYQTPSEAGDSFTRGSTNGDVRMREQKGSTSPREREISPRSLKDTPGVTRNSTKHFDLVSELRDDEHVPEFPPLTWFVKIVYGLPQFSMLSLTLVISIYGNPYYEKMGAGLSFIAFFTALARSFDVMTDPLMGWISDNTRLYFGRRRPYMFIGMFGFSVFFTLLMYPPFTPSGSDSNQTSYWFGFFYVIFYVFDTVANVPYQALGPELSPIPEERTTAFFFGKMFAGIGTLIGATSPEIFKQLLGGGEDIRTLKLTFLYISLIFGVLYIIFMTLVTFSVKERPQEVDSPKIPLVPSVLRSFKNRAFRPLLIGWVLDAIALSTIAAMFPFFIEYVILPKTLTVGVTQMYCFGALFCSALAAMPLWKMLAKRFGRYPVWMAFNLLNFATNALYIVVAEGDPWYTIGITLLNGIPLGGVFLTDTILADVIDYDEFLNGTRNEGGFTVFATFIPKFVSVPAGALPLSVMAMIGFRPSINGVSQPQTPAVRNFIRFMFVVVPCLCALLAYFAKRFYPLKTEAMVEDLMSGIEAHHQGRPALDPITGEVVALLQFDSPDEQEHAWVLDNFSHRQLQYLVAPEIGYKRGTAKIVRETKLLIVLGVVMTGVFVALTAGFFTKLDDAALSLVPIMSVVLAGMGTCFTVVSVMRYRAAVSLSTLGIKESLIEAIITHKEKGQRGGAGLNEAEVLSKALTTYNKFMIELENKDRELLERDQEIELLKARLAAVELTSPVAQRVFSDSKNGPTTKTPTPLSAPSAKKKA